MKLISLTLENEQPVHINIERISAIWASPSGDTGKTVLCVDGANYHVNDKIEDVLALVNA